MQDELRPSDAFAARLKEIRKARGLTQEELAAQASDVGIPLSKTALVRIERAERRRDISLDEALGLTACLGASFAILLSPPPGNLLALTDKLAVDGPALRPWLVTGSPFPVWPMQPREEDVDTLNVWLEDRLTGYSVALTDAVRARDIASVRAMTKAIVEAVESYRTAVREATTSREEAIDAN